MTDIVEFTPESPSEIDNNDGTMTVFLDSAKKNKKQSKHGDNLADVLDDSELAALGMKYIDLIERDIEARESRDKQYALGIKRTGIAEPAPGGATFEGASRVTHPALAESYIDFSASSIKELFPPNGPVRSKIEGKVTHDKLDRAKRKAAFMNWQLTSEIRGYRGELERLLTQLPAGGTQFLKVFWSEDKMRIDVEFVPIDDFILPYNAKNFYDCQRKFQRMTVSRYEYLRNVKSGLWKDFELPSSVMPMLTQAATANQKIEGKSETSFNDDGDRLIFEGCIWEQLEDDDRQKPYMVTIDKDSERILSLYRNWDEDDEKFQELEYIVDFNFIPWRGAYGIGIPHLAGGLADAMTGALRALLDSALIANSQAAVRLKGVGGGANNTIDADWSDCAADVAVV